MPPLMQKSLPQNRYNQKNEHLGTRRETIYQWIEEKEMPAHRVGRY